MEVIRFNARGSRFDVISESELEIGDLFFTFSDCLFTWEGGALYLDYQERKKTNEESSIIDGGGVPLCNVDILQNYEPEDLKDGGDLEALKNDIFCSLDFYGIFYSDIGAAIYKNACKILESIWNN